MLISTEGISRYLGKKDVPAPFIAIMDYVTKVPELRNPDVLHFTDTRIKPHPLNLTARRVIVAAYGNDPAAWHGKPLEVYVDPGVTNSQGQVTGGIRVRIPSAPARPVPANVTVSKLAAALSPLENHLLALDGMRNARSLAKLDEWAKWRKGIAGTTRAQDDDAEDCYRVNQDRLTPPPGPASFRRPVTA